MYVICMRQGYRRLAAHSSVMYSRGWLIQESSILLNLRRGAYSMQVPFPGHKNMKRRTAEMLLVFGETLEPLYPFDRPSQDSRVQQSATGTSVFSRSCPWESTSGSNLL